MNSGINQGIRIFVLPSRSGNTSRAFSYLHEGVEHHLILLPAMSESTVKHCTFKTSSLPYPYSSNNIIMPNRLLSVDDRRLFGTLHSYEWWEAQSQRMRN